MRVGLQWMRNYEDQVPDQYRGVVFQVFTSFSSNAPIISVQNADNYFEYQNNGGELNMTEYLDAMVLGQAGLSRSLVQVDLL